MLLLDDFLGNGGSVMATKRFVHMLRVEVAEAYFIFDILAYLEENKETLGALPWYTMVHITAENMPPILN